MKDLTRRRRFRFQGFQLACWLFLFSLTAIAEHLPLKSYTVADGLPHNSINKIVRDSRGFLWFCTDEGLSRFDGYEFTNYGTGAGLPHAVVTDIVETRKGDYWVATYGGLCKFNPRGVPSSRVAYGGDSSPDAPRNPMFTVYTPNAADRKAKAFSTLVEARDGTLWCGTWKGLFRLAQSGKSVELVRVEIGLPSEANHSVVNTVLEDRHGTLWVGSESGLYRRWSDGSAARYGKGQGLPERYVDDLLEDRYGNVWVGTDQDGLYQLSNEDARRPPTVTRSYNRKNGFISDWIFDLHEASDGRLLVGTNFGLAEFSADLGKRANPEHMYTRRNGFNYHEIVTLSEDRDGNLWLGTINGAMKLALNGFLTFGAEDGIATVNSFFESEAGELYAFGYVLGDKRAAAFDGGRVDTTTNNEVQYWPGIGHFDGEHFTWLWPNALKGKLVSWSDRPFITQTRGGEWWIGRYLFSPVDSFAQLKSARPLVDLADERGLAFPVVSAVYEDSQGDVWISSMRQGTTRSALTRWDHKSRTLIDLGQTEGLPSLEDKLVSAFEEDKAGNIWLGFYNGGLARYVAGRFTLVTTDEGLPQGAIKDLHLDHEGRLWIATSRGGIGRIDDPGAERPAFVHYSTDQGLSSNFVTALTEDLSGRIYAGTGRGLDQISPATGQIRHFTTADGLAPGEIAGAFRERSGALWFGTRTGLSRFLPQLEHPSQPPPILINELRVEGLRQNISQLGETNISLPDFRPGEDRMQINFVGLNFAPGEELHYQYRLEGADADWSPRTVERTVNFARLAPGRYCFLVRAVNSDGVFSPAPAIVTFTILRPTWQRWWFLLLATFVIGLSVYGLYRYRVARLLEVANIRTRIATDLHDDIGANLTRIAILSEVARKRRPGGETESDRPLASIARISRESVAAMSDIVWAINPQGDSLLDLVRRMRRHAEDVLSSQGIDLSFTAPDPSKSSHLEADLRRAIFLIFKEAVSNVARHSQCSRASIDFRIDGRWLVLEVADDGIGFASADESGGHGLTSMRRRAQRIAGEMSIDSQPGAGTIVRLRVKRP